MVKKRAMSVILVSLFVLLYACGFGGTSASGSEEDDNVRVLIYEDRVMFVYLDYSSYQEYMANAANSLFAAMPNTVNKYLMITPSRTTFETNDLRGIAADERTAAQFVYKNMDSDIRYIDAYYALSQYKGDLNDIYFRLDHHWTQLGSYYAAEAFMIAARVPYHSLDEYTAKEGKAFAGYMYLISGDTELAKKLDSLIYYQLPGNEHKKAVVYTTDSKTGLVSDEELLLIDPSRNGYEIFIDQFGFSHIVIPGDENSNRALMIIGGSSAYALAPFLADNFNTVVLIENRFYKGGEKGIKELIEKYNITDVLLCTSFNSYILEFE